MARKSQHKPVKPSKTSNRVLAVGPHGTQEVSASEFVSRASHLRTRDDARDPTYAGPIRKPGGSSPDPALGDTQARPVTVPQLEDLGLVAPGIAPARPQAIEVAQPPNGKNGQGTPDSFPDRMLIGESGVPGTYIGSGFVRDLGEYNPELYGWNAMRVYQRMRRSDADCWSLLQAIKLPILAVEPQFYPALESGPGRGNLNKEICDRVRDNLLGGLEFTSRGGNRVTQTFEEVMRNDLLCIDFGCSASEDLFISDPNHGGDGLDIRLRGIAPRLPETFYRFWTDVDGETLLGLEQLGYRRERYVNTTIPASNLTLNVINKEGANFYGISVLRAAYQHWYVKSALYRLDAMGLERNSMGIPWIKGAPGAKKQDAAFAQNWVQQMAAGERTGLYTPDGYEFSLVGLRGRLRDPQPSIKHHSEMIVRSGLAMFIALGTTQTGSHALANVQLDFFRRSLENYGRLICANRNNTTVRRLVDANYASKDGHHLPYPTMALPTIVVIDPIEAATVLKELAQAQVGIVNPSDELEDDVLKIFGYRRGTPRTRVAPVVTQIRIMGSPAGEEEVSALQKGYPAEGEEIGPEQKGAGAGGGGGGGTPKGGAPPKPPTTPGVHPARSQGDPDLNIVDKDPAIAVSDNLDKLFGGRQSRAYKREHPEGEKGSESTSGGGSGDGGGSKGKEK